MYASLINKFNCGCIVSVVGNTVLRSKWCITRKFLSRDVRYSSGSSKVLSPPWKVLFFGTDEFSVESLKKLTKELESGQLIKQLEVVTSVKPKANVVQNYAEKNMLKVHNWAYSTIPDEFDLGIVVSFGHLIPENIISLFSLGMFNVHASLLPRWRGAAPIVYAIMNGDTETGVTVMQIKPHKFDIGGMLKQAKFPLPPHTTFPLVRYALACLGSEILLECLQDMPLCLDKIQEQSQEGVTYAPRISSSLACVKWDIMSSVQVYNLWRALDGIYPLTSNWHGATIRFYVAQLVQTNDAEEPVRQYLDSVHPGYAFYHKSSKLLRVKCSDGKWISFHSIGLPAKKPMLGADFHNGYISKQKEDNRYFT